MTTKADFTPEEWEQLLEMPMTAAMYIIMADPAVFGSIKEAYSVAKSIATQAQKPDNTELLRFMLADLQDKEQVKQAQPEIDKKNAAGAMQALLDDLTAGVALMDQKATPEESTQIRHWLYQLAVNTAEASKEGGFLGIGAVRVSDAEKSALQDLAAVLKVDGDS